MHFAERKGVETSIFRLQGEKEKEENRIEIRKFFDPIRKRLGAGTNSIFRESSLYWPTYYGIREVP